MRRPAVKKIGGFWIDCWPMEATLNPAIALNDQEISAPNARMIASGLIKAAEWLEWERGRPPGKGKK